MFMQLKKWVLNKNLFHLLNIMGSSITIITGNSFKFHSNKIFLLVGVYFSYFIYLCTYVYVYYVDSVFTCHGFLSFHPNRNLF